MDENPYKPSSTVDSGSSGKSGSGILKKILFALGIFMLLIILLFGWIGYKTASTYNKLEGRAEPLIREVIKTQSPWNFATVKPHLSKLWVDMVSDEDNEKLIRL